MTTWTNSCGNEIPIPEEIVEFYAEYEQLCRKHGLMVLSDGEDIEIGEADDTLWSLKTGVANAPQRWPKMVPCRSPKPGCLEQKAWGQVAHIWASPEVAISYLRVNAGTRSSWHLHRDRYNAFYVTAGKVIIEVELHDLVSQVELRPGKAFAVEPGRKHRFRVIQGGRMVEVYWPKDGATCRADDIERFDVGGVDEPDHVDQL